ncbi:MAG: hypothetical protein HDR82_09675 [Bacteroides sp.]|nr:hypothetical protein [Bacteroides sp.]
MNDGLKEKLINTAHAKGICADGYRQMLGSADRGAMVEYYVANPDWCLERDFPTLQVLRDFFADEEDRGVFVDRVFDGEVLNERQAYVLHNCSGTVRVGLNVGRAIIPMLYIANGCRLRIEGVEPSGMGTMRDSRFRGGRDESRRPCTEGHLNGGAVRVPVEVFGENEVCAVDNGWVVFNVYKNGLI